MPYNMAKRTNHRKKRHHECRLGGTHARVLAARTAQPLHTPLGLHPRLGLGLLLDLHVLLASRCHQDNAADNENDKQEPTCHRAERI